jgi:hypothetical protein
MAGHRPFLIDASDAGGPQPISVAELIFAELEFESIPLVAAALALSLLFWWR